jgi:hypothetical protein
MNMSTGPGSIATPGSRIAQQFKKTSQEYSLNNYTINRIVPPS